jgi:hypothetical protein
MNRQLLARLEALENRKQNVYVPPPPIPLAMYLVAFFAGKWQPHESPADAYHRGLGLERATQFHALTSEEVAERHRTAFARICRRRKIDPVLVAQSN